jgi:hypothetical protein
MGGSRSSGLERLAPALLRRTARLRWLEASQAIGYYDPERRQSPAMRGMLGIRGSRAALRKVRIHFLPA